MRSSATAFPARLGNKTPTRIFYERSFRGKRPLFFRCDCLGELLALIEPQKHFCFRRFEGVQLQFVHHDFLKEWARENTGRDNPYAIFTLDYDMAVPAIGFFAYQAGSIRSLGKHVVSLTWKRKSNHTGIIFSEVLVLERLP